jgi:hypothetical protein
VSKRQDNLIKARFSSSIRASNLAGGRSKVKKLVLAVAVALSLTPVFAWADNVTAKAATKPAEKKASQAVRLSDAELDKITAGAAVVDNGAGLTWVFNAGNASMLKINNKRFVCINCF